MNKSENSLEMMLTNPKFRVGILLLLGLAVLLFVLALRTGGATRPIKPVVATRTPGAMQIDDAVAVTFADLEADPLLYRNQRIEVAGQYSPIARPRCRSFSGIKTEWGLVDGTLLMNAVGYEKVVRPLPNQLEMRVEGIWRFYPGPVGCGKESREGSGMWYLEVERIIQPNPLPIVASGGVVQIVPRGNTAVDLLPGVTPIGSGSTPGTPGELPTPTIESGTPAPTGTSSIIISTLTPSPPSTETTATGTSTATVRATSAPGGTATATATATVTTTPDSSDPPPSPTQPGIGPPPAPTATPGGGGYPGGTATPYP